MSISAMKQALEALEGLWDDGFGGVPESMHKDAIAALRQAIAEAEKQEPVAIGEEWKPCVKLPIIVHVREQRKGETHVSTREGITPVKEDDLIMRGVAGEEYPIGRELFNRTYTFDTAPVHASDISQERVDETAKDRHEPVVWLDNGLGVFYWASEFSDRPVPPGFEPLYAAQPRTWSSVTDDALIEEVRRRGFPIRDAQISPKIKDEYELCCQKYDTCAEPCTPRGRHLAKREWVGLTDEERHELNNFRGLMPFIHAIEAKLKEKNS